MSDETISNGPGHPWSTDPDNLVADLRDAFAKVATMPPVARRIRVTTGMLRTLTERCSVGPESASGIEIVTDETLPLGRARIEWSDGSETDLDLRRAANAREET